MNSLKTMKKMMKILNINKILLFVFISSICIAQQSSFKVDTTKTLNLSPPIELLEYHNNLYFSEEFNLMSLYTSFIDDTSSVWIKTRFQLGNFSDQLNSNNNLQSILDPLQQNYIKSQSMKTFKMILGSVQAGAVGYLAYKHLKKYGLFKKK